MTGSPTHRTGGKKCATEHSGFTFIELVMTLTIIGVLAYFTIPKVESLFHTRIGTAASVIASDIRYAQSRAIATQENHSVVFDSNQNRYQVQDSDGDVVCHPVMEPNGVPGACAVQSFVVQLGTGDFNGISINADYTVTFNALGEATVGGGGGVTIVSSDTDPQVQKTIGVAAFSGRVTIN